jgi:hypothetical protein
MSLDGDPYFERVLEDNHELRDELTRLKQENLLLKRRLNVNNECITDGFDNWWSR